MFTIKSMIEDCDNCSFTGWHATLRNSDHSQGVWKYTENSPAACHPLQTLRWCQRNNSGKSVSMLQLGGHLSLEWKSALNLTFYWEHFFLMIHWDVKYSWNVRCKTGSLFFFSCFICLLGKITIFIAQILHGLFLPLFLLGWPRTRQQDLG